MEDYKGKPDRSINKKLPNPLENWWEKTKRIIDRKNFLSDTSKKKLKGR